MFLSMQMHCWLVGHSLLLGTEALVAILSCQSSRIMGQAAQGSGGISFTGEFREEAGLDGHRSGLVYEQPNLHLCKGLDKGS